VVSDLKACIQRVLDDDVIPHLERAYRAIDLLDWRDIIEMQSMRNPPLMLRRVGEAFCVMFEERPEWQVAITLLSDFCPDRIKDYDKDEIDPGVLKEIERYMASEDFVPDNIQRVSLAGAAICTWIHSVYKYASIVPTLGPQMDVWRTENEKWEDLAFELDCWKALTRDAT